MKQIPIYQGKIYLYVALLLISILVMMSIRTCSTDSPFTKQEYKQSAGDTLDVAIEYSPLSMYRYADTLGGFNYDLLRLMADRYDFVLKFHPISNFSSSLSRLDNGDYDILVADIPMTSELEGNYIFTEPSFLSRQVLIQLRDSAGELSVNSSLDLAGKHVVVSRGSSALLRLRNLSEEIGDTIYVEEDSINGTEQLLLLTAAGKVKYAVVNDHLARRMSPKFPNLDLSTNVSFTQFQSWMLSKENQPLKARLDSCLIEIKTSEEYKLLKQRYLDN